MKWASIHFSRQRRGGVVVFGARGWPICNGLAWRLPFRA